MTIPRLINLFHDLLRCFKKLKCDNGFHAWEVTRDQDNCMMKLNRCKNCGMNFRTLG